MIQNLTLNHEAKALSKWQNCGNNEKILINERRCFSKFKATDGIRPPAAGLEEIPLPPFKITIDREPPRIYR
jgi:hypothetical protein